METSGDAFHALHTHAHSARVWRSGDEPMYGILVINGHVTWNDKALIPAQCILSRQSWGLEFSQGFVCGSADCWQTMNPLIEQQTFQSLKRWVWFRLPNVQGYVSSRTILELLWKYRSLLCFSRLLQKSKYLRKHTHYFSKFWGLRFFSLKEVSSAH